MFGSSKNLGGITYIAAGCRITGETHLAGDTLVGGTLMGSIQAEQKVSIEADGVIEGELHCQELKVAGVFRGKLQCDRLVITATGVVEGEVASRTMEILAGGQFVGVRVKEEVNLLQDLSKSSKVIASHSLNKLSLQSE